MYLIFFRHAILSPTTSLPSTCFATTSSRRDTYRSEAKKAPLKRKKSPGNIVTIFSFL